MSNRHELMYYWPPFVCAVPANALVIATLIRPRKHSEVKKPFFRMLLSLSINDMVCCILNVILIPLLVSDSALRKYPLAMGIFSFGLPHVFLNNDFVAYLGIALNRMVNFVWPLQASVIWRPVHTKAVIVTQWIVSIIFVLTLVVPEGIQHTYINNTTGGISDNYIVKRVDPNSLYDNVVTITNLLLQMVAMTSLVIMYMISVVFIVCFKLKTGQTDGFVAEIRLGIQGFLISFSAFVSMVMYAHLFITGNLVFAVAWTNWTYNYAAGPFIMVAMSCVLRDRMKAIFKKPNQIQPINVKPHNAK